jgi:drug/metabolite transporter (DMT)-like permease
VPYILNTKNDKLLKTVLFTTLALIAFAANSVLCRLALGERTLDPSGFTIIRLLSGAAVLLIILKIKNRNKKSKAEGSWSASFMLFLYAVTFSFAYVTLDTATGALILFGSVQTTMILLSLISGNRLHLTEWLGVITAFFGFLFLVIPAVTTPSVIGFLLMSIAGVSWGIYTLKGRTSKEPMVDTAYNFIRSVVFVLILVVISFKDMHLTIKGVLLAVSSGGLASGIGYIIWYKALGGLSAVQAAVVQLLVPAIAAFGGVIFVSEVITLRLVVAALMILGGILLVVLGRYYFVQIRTQKKLRQFSNTKE